MVGRIGKIIATAAEYNMKNPNDFVRYTQAITTPFYYAYQSLAYYRSKNIEEDKRKFIVAQTLAEGAMTTALVIKIPKKLVEIGEKLVDRAIVLPSSGMPANLKNPEGVASILNGKVGNPKLTEKLVNFKSGVSMATNIFGIFLIFGVITPIIRNFIAKYLQNFIKSGKTGNNPQKQKSLKPEASKNQINLSS